MVAEESVTRAVSCNETLAGDEAGDVQVCPASAFPDRRAEDPETLLLDTDFQELGRSGIRTPAIVIASTNSDTAIDAKFEVRILQPGDVTRTYDRRPVRTASLRKSERESGHWREEVKLKAPTGFARGAMPRVQANAAASEVSDALEGGIVFPLVVRKKRSESQRSRSPRRRYAEVDSNTSGKKIERKEENTARKGFRGLKEVLETLSISEVTKGAKGAEDWMLEYEQARAGADGPPQACVGHTPDEAPPLKSKSIAKLLAAGVPRASDVRGVSKGRVSLERKAKTVIYGYGYKRDEMGTKMTRNPRPV